MSGILWYYLLAAIGLAMGAYTMYKKKNFSTFIAFYLYAASSTFTGEYFALVIFQGYIYMPGVFSKPCMDSLLGHLIINLTLWPGFGIAVWAFSYRYVGIAVVTAIFLLAEYLFEMLGIYRQFWWRYYMSAIIVVAYLVISKFWLGKVNEKMRGLTRYTTLFFAGQVIIQVPQAVLLLSEKLYYHVGWVESIYRDHTIFTVITSTVISLFFVLFASVLKKWYFKLVPLFLFIILDLILVSMNIIVFLDGFNIYYLIAVQSFCLAVFICMEKFTLRKKIDLQAS